MGSLYRHKLSEADQSARWLRLHESQRGTCFICRCSIDLHVDAKGTVVDHVESLKTSGADGPANFALVWLDSTDGRAAVKVFDLQRSVTVQALVGVDARTPGTHPVLEFGRKATDKPLSHSTIEKTSLCFFIYPDVLDTRPSFRTQDGISTPETKVEQVALLMNLVGDEVFLGQYEPALGVAEMEHKVHKGVPSPSRSCGCFAWARRFSIPDFAACARSPRRSSASSASSRRRPVPVRVRRAALGSSPGLCREPRVSPQMGRLRPVEHRVRDQRERQLLGLGLRDRPHPGPYLHRPGGTCDAISRPDMIKDAK